MDFYKNILAIISIFLKNISKKEIIMYSSVSILVLLLVFIFTFWTSNSNFPTETTFQIKKGLTLNVVASELEKENYIRSEFWFKSFVTVFGGSRSIVAGDYYFEKKETLISVAWRVMHGNYGLTQLKVTIPEGLTNIQIAELFKKQFSLFNSELFIKSAQQGRMFPDTYFFLVNVSTEDIISRMKQNFDKKIFSIQTDIGSSTRTLDQIINMASILEEEAKTQVDRKIIADILWKRIKIGMPLQVDSAMETYDRKGLPDKPISNPGLESILDALYPTKTPYLYFLSDSKGKLYYAKDFDEHQRNREMYFKK